MSEEDLDPPVNRPGKIVARLGTERRATDENTPADQARRSRFGAVGPLPPGRCREIVAAEVGTVIAAATAG